MTPTLQDETITARHETALGGADLTLTLTLPALETVQRVTRGINTRRCEIYLYLSIFTSAPSIKWTFLHCVQPPPPPDTTKDRRWSMRGTETPPAGLRATTCTCSHSHDPLLAETPLSRPPLPPTVTGDPLLPPRGAARARNKHLYSLNTLIP